MKGPEKQTFWFLFENTLEIGSGLAIITGGPLLMVLGILAICDGASGGNAIRGLGNTIKKFWG